MNNENPEIIEEAVTTAETVEEAADEVTTATAAAAETAATEPAEPAGSDESHELQKTTIRREGDNTHEKGFKLAMGGLVFGLGALFLAIGQFECYLLGAIGVVLAAVAIARGNRTRLPKIAIILNVATMILNTVLLVVLYSGRVE